LEIGYPLTKARLERERRPRSAARGLFAGADQLIRMRMSSGEALAYSAKTSK
jgi:hypothetical protein